MQAAPVQHGPTYGHHPDPSRRRATFRTVVQLPLAQATLVPSLVTGIYTGQDAVAVAVLGATATFTRGMASTQVEDFLARWAPWLAADEYEPQHRDD